MKQVIAGTLIILTGFILSGCQLKIQAESDSQASAPTTDPEAKIPLPEEETTPIVVVPGNVNIQLSLEESAGVDWGTTNIRSGVPFSKGQISQSDSLILSRNGQQIPLEHRPLSLWNDGSIRWMLLDT